MSTLSGKPRGPIDLSSYVSQKARERQESGQEPVPEPGQGADQALDGHSQAIRSPYAPKPRHLDLAGRDGPEEAPTIQPGIGPRAEVPFDAPAADRAGPDRLAGPRFEREQDDSPRGRADWPAVDAGADAPVQPHGGEPRHDPLPAMPPAPEQPASLQPGSPGSDRRERSGQEQFSDRDFERLESSLRWLQRQEADVRMPRGPTLGPVSGLSSVEDRGRSGRLIRSLEPERMAPPPAGARRGSLPAVMAILSVVAVVATAAYFLLAGGSAPDPKPESRLASVNPMYATPTSRPEPAVAAGQEDEQALARARIASRFAERIQEQRNLPAAESTVAPAAVQPAAVQPVPNQPVPVQPVPVQTTKVEPAAPPPPAPPARSGRTLDPEEVKTLIKKGEQFIAVGDLPAARIVFRRAAEAGDPSAAVALGATYDPIVLARLGVVGMSAADVEKARTWYQTAENMGSPEATRRLRILANR